MKLKVTRVQESTVITDECDSFAEAVEEAKNAIQLSYGVVRTGYYKIEQMTP